MSEHSFHGPWDTEAVARVATAYPDTIYFTVEDR